ncbi:uncharacterized protein BP01DRAFT_408695 [Aspergillus saccharolyticus JOP 1030-1]|uniref:Uncharacterized protein n=1 Tax=Aspergillus saccharolyticus JOP 1030-1 TaxID=1450539 RepID=A0A318Z202_9EURO|nr:hypothetical protein BP01DRAFT_408695 [Aspergillus saccharolyticus JOP 1030-1]PYH40959.1 hypothetical protein BP01DRAFT_408695 [Aspergillus saccharolyticus JOP 1030-1]
MQASVFSPAGMYLAVVIYLMKRTVLTGCCIYLTWNDYASKFQLTRLMMMRRNPGYRNSSPSKQQRRGFFERRQPTERDMIVVERYKTKDAEYMRELLEWQKRRKGDRWKPKRITPVPVQKHNVLQLPLPLSMCLGSNSALSLATPWNSSMR